MPRRDRPLECSIGTPTLLPTLLLPTHLGLALDSRQHRQQPKLQAVEAHAVGGHLQHGQGTTTPLTAWTRSLLLTPYSLLLTPHSLLLTPHSSLLQHEQGRTGDQPGGAPTLAAARAAERRATARAVRCRLPGGSVRARARRAARPRTAWLGFELGFELGLAYVPVLGEPPALEQPG